MEIDLTEVELTLLKRLLQENVDTLQLNTAASRSPGKRRVSFAPKLQSMSGTAAQSVLKKIINSLKVDAL